MATMTYSEVVGQSASPCMTCMRHPAECFHCSTYAIWLESRKIAVRENLDEISRLCNRIMSKYDESTK